MKGALVMEFKEVIKNRFSCRKYSDKEVEAKKLTAILEAGRLAPTAKNLQEQRVYVLQSSAALAKIDSVMPCRYGAPVVIAVAYDKNNVFTYPGGKKQYGDEDAAIVATQMILAATDEGLNSLWNNFTGNRRKDAGRDMSGSLYDVDIRAEMEVPDPLASGR